MKLFFASFAIFCSILASASALQVDCSAPTNITRTSAFMGGTVVSTNGTTNALSLVLYYGGSDASTNAGSWSHSVTSRPSALGGWSTNITALTPASPYYYRFHLAEGTSTTWAAASTSFWILAGSPTGSPPAATAWPVMADVSGNVVAPTNLALATSSQVSNLQSQITTNTAEISVLKTNTATKAQGAKADTAVQPATLSVYVTNNQPAVAFGTATVSRLAGTITPENWTWTERTNAGSQAWTSIASSADGANLAAVIYGGTIWTSTNSGTTWTNQTGAGSGNWTSIASSADGTKLAVVMQGGGIWTSTDSGTTWTIQTGAGSGSWASIASSADGTNLAAVIDGGTIWTSADAGTTWTNQTGAGSGNWMSIASSADGTNQAAVMYGGAIWTSTNTGTTWTNQTGAGSRTWVSIASSADGTKLAAVMYGDIWTSADSGTTWTNRTGAGSGNWMSIASSADGTHLAAVMYGGAIWTSTDSGATWTNQTGAGSGNWRDVAFSDDGTKLAAVRQGGAIWTGQFTPAVASRVGVSGSLYFFSDGGSIIPPTSTNGLPSGAVWNDAGTLKVTP